MTNRTKHGALFFKTEPAKPTITIVIERGCLVEVKNLPDGWCYKLDDRDVDSDDGDDGGGPLLAQAKSFSVDGKRHKLPPQVPAHQIEWVVGQSNVGATDAQITAKVDKGTKDWTAADQRAARLFAVKCHRDNQNLSSLQPSRPRWFAKDTRRP